MNCSNVRMAWPSAQRICTVARMAGDPIDSFPPLLRADPRDGGVGCVAVYAHALRGGAAGSRTRDGELSLTLQESSVGVDELVRLDIANGDTGHVGGICRDRSRRVEGVLVLVKSRSACAEAEMPQLDIELFRALRGTLRERGR